MDIIPNKKSKLLYQRGDRKLKGVIDLRCFNDEKNRYENINNKNKIIFEIKKKSDIELKVETNNFYRRLETEKKQADDFSKIKKKIEKTKKKNIILAKINKFEKEPASYKKNSFLNFKNGLLNTCPLLIKQKSFISFFLLLIIVPAIIFSLSFLQKETERKGRVLGVGTQAYGYLKSAGRLAIESDFEKSIENFNLAGINFSDSKKMISEFGFGIASVLNSIPLNTPVSTAENLADAGENISLAGKNISFLMDKFSHLNEKNFLLNSVSDFQENINNIAFYLNKAQENINQVNIDYVPSDLQNKINIAKSQLPTISADFNNLATDFPSLTKLLGINRSQKYLLIFQNSDEMRATGGFVGSYGILDMEDGKIKNLFIDGIFNPDGQLTEKIVPPMPIQKISAAWSMHDANWFADFPTSAQKTALFYEKTGGPTVDGVIAITPTVIEKMLEIAGPIEMPAYNIIIDKDNFVTETQAQVEDLYKREENKPKQILADLAPQIMNNLFNVENLNPEEKTQRYLDLINIMEESFREKHMIFYHRDQDIENMIIKRGWGGQTLNHSGDYLSVIHSNINGYKTDAVIEEKIIHSSEISSNGSIIDTVRIIRKHNGGESDYDWYNRVNSDYLRVFVPLGSVLLEARGHTWQDYEPPIDYSNFRVDPDVKKIEDTLRIDQNNGTHIFEESEKTVFGNWVYVSPGETVEVFYKYRLPFRVNFNNFTKLADKYSVLVQKQAGSSDIKFSGSIKLPENWDIIWNSENLLFRNSDEMIVNTDLDVDKIYGIVFMNEDNDY